MGPLPSDADGRTAFHGAALAGHARHVAKRLAQLTKRAQAAALAQRDSRGRTPAHSAAYAGNLRALRLLLDAAPDVLRMRDSDGFNVFDALRAEHVPSPDGALHYQRLLSWGYNVGGQLAQESHEPRVSPAYCKGIGSEAGGIVSISLGPSALAVATQSGHAYVATSGSMLKAIEGVSEIVDVSVARKSVLIVSRTNIWVYKNGVAKPLEEDLPDFEWTDRGGGTAFDALGSLGRDETDRLREPCEPLLGCSTCDTFSTVWTASKIWFWGSNTRASMMGRAPRGANILDPVLIIPNARKRLGAPIANVKVTGNLGIVVRLVTGAVFILADDTATQVVQNASAMAVADKFIVTQVGDRLFRLALPSKESVKVWTARRPKDSVLSFDVSLDGSVIIATLSGVYNWSDGGQLVEVPSLVGIRLASVRCDLAGNALCGVHEFSMNAPDLEWVVADVDTSAAPATLQLCAGDKVCASAPIEVVAGRCPELRSRITDGKLIFLNAPESAVIAFAELCCGGDAASGSLLRGLDVFVRVPMPQALWDSRGRNCGTDISVISSDGHCIVAHGWILAQKSEFFATRLARWTSRKTAKTGSAAVEINIDWPLNVLERVFAFIYTGEEIEFTDSSARDKAGVAQLIFDVWQAALQLLVDGIADECQRALLKLMDFDLAVPLYSVLPRSPLRQSLLDLITRHMEFCVFELGDLDSSRLDAVEQAFKKPRDVTEDEITRLLALPVTAVAVSNAGDNAKVTENISKPNDMVALKSPKAHSSTETPSVAKGSLSTAKPKPLDKQPVVAAAHTVTSSTSQTNDGWVRTRRKSRPSGSGTRPQIVEPVTPLPTRIVRKASPKNGSTPEVLSPKSFSPVAGSSSSPSAVPPLSHSSGTSHSNAQSPASQLPGLGSLPTLGTRRQTTPKSRPKLGGRRKMKLVEDPFSDPLVSTSSGEAAAGPPAQSPWKQVSPPKSSHDLVESLTRRSRLEQGAWATGGGW